MSYFKTSFATLQKIAQAGRYEYLAGFLVLARHASGLSHAGFGPYKLSGAGINGIHEKAAVSEETARGVIEFLQQQKIIRPVAAETKRAFFAARWEILQGELDLDLPHALVDQPKDVSTEYSALRRLRKKPAAGKRYSKELKDVSDTELYLDALMTLLAIYKNTSMQVYGGLSPKCAYREWEVKSHTKRLGSIRWGAEPKNMRAYTEFMALCINQKPAKKDGTLNEVQANRFWNALESVKDTGLIYEAVALFDVSPMQNSKALFMCTLRVNDYHAGAAGKPGGDLSLLRTLEESSGAQFAYYTHPGNDRGEPEAMWFLWHEDRGFLTGIWRPRFRASNQDAGLWIEHENSWISAVASTLQSRAEEVGQFD